MTPFQFRPASTRRSAIPERASRGLERQCDVVEGLRGRDWLENGTPPAGESIDEQSGCLVGCGEGHGGGSSQTL